MTIPTALNTVLRQAATMLAGDRRLPDRIVAADGPHVPAGHPDLTATFVDAGSFMLQQLKVALGLAATSTDVDGLVPDVLARAAAFGYASPGAVGAAATFVDDVRVDDPLAMARSIVAARSVFGDAELIAAAASLVAALSARIAEQLALDPIAAHTELCDLSGMSFMVCPSWVGRLPVPLGSVPLCTRRFDQRRAAAPVTVGRD